MTYGGLRVLGAGVLAMICAWAGARIYMNWQARSGAEMHAPAGLASAPTPADEAADLDVATLPPRIPDKLPDFSLSNLDGKSTPISTWAGRPLVINFWATWCAPCRREIPLLNTLAGEWASQDDVAVVGIAVDHRDQVSQFAAQFKIGYPLLVGEEDALDVAAKFGVASPAFPFTVFTDRRGEVVALFVGELHRKQADLIMSVVQNLNKGSVQLVQARRQIAQGLDALAEKTS
jgi:thiol-disulfide isomerase/thioredoxin